MTTNYWTLPEQWLTEEDDGALPDVVMPEICEQQVDEVEGERA